MKKNSKVRSSKVNARAASTRSSKTAGKTSAAKKSPKAQLTKGSAAASRPSVADINRYGSSRKQGRRGLELHDSVQDMPTQTRENVCEILNQSLAECFDLRSQVKQAHWNVKGLDFYQLHLLFDEFAAELEEFVDLFAERVTTLAGTAMGTARMAAAGTTLPEMPADITEGIDFIAALADRFGKFGATCRDNIDECDDLGDKDTADLYTEVSRAIDKNLWFLEAHLQGELSAKIKR